MIVQPELRVASPPSEVSCVQSPETRPLNDTNQTATSDDIIDQTAISNPPSELNDIDLNSKLNNPNVKLPSSPILIANPSSIHTSVSKLSKSLPITTSLSDSTQLTSEDTVECSSVTNDHYHCRRRSESSLQPEVNHSLETLTLTPPSTSTSSSTTSTTLSTDTNLSPTITSLTLPSLALKEPAQTQTQSPAQLITIPKPETDIKRFFLQRHPDGRLLLVPFDAIVTATIQPQFAQASTTVQPQPEVDNNSAPNSNLVSVSTLPRSPLFRISLADSSSSTAFPLLSNSEISDPTSPLVITTAIIPQSPTIANEQLSISVPVTRAELLVVNSAGNTCDNSDESPALSVTHPSPSPQKNNSSSPTTSSSLPNSADSQTSTTMTSYIFAQQQNTAAGTQQQIQQQQTHQNHQQNSPLPPVETIFSVSDSHHHMNNHSLGQSHQNLSHLAHTHPQSISNSNLSMIHNNRASRFDDFDPLFADMSEQQFTPTTVINDHHIDYYGQVDSTTTLIEDDDEDEMLSASKCLPFGYYYDDQKMFNKLEMISSSLPSSTTSSSSPLLDALELNDLFTSSTTTNSGPPQHHQSHPQSQSHAHNHQQQQQSNSNQTISINLNPTLHHHHHQTSTHIKQEFSPNNTNSEQFQVFHSSYASSNGYGMAGYGQDPLISGRLSKTTSSTPEQALIKASDIKEENDDEMLAMMSWPEQVASGQHFVAGGSHGERPSIAHNTISSTSSPTVVNEFWSNGCQSALQSPTIATSSNGNHGGNGTPCLQDGQIFEDLLVPDLDDGSLEIENILSSQNQMFGSPPKLSNCLVGKDSTSGPNFARPSFVRQGHVGQPVHPTVLGELLLRDNVSTTPINGNNSSNSYLPTGGHPVGSILVLPPKTQSNDNQMQTSPTATIHHRPQAPTPLQQQQRSNAMQSNCPTLAALITRPTATIVSHPQPHHNPHQANHQSQQTLTNQPQPLHLRTIIANEMALHGMSNRNRNNSMSTDYSISSHDEGFASQQEDGSESDESAILSLPPEPDTMEGEMFYMNMSSATSQPIPIHNHPGHQQMAACMFQQPSTSFDDSEMLHHQHNGSVSEDEEEEEDDDDDESFYGDYNAEDLLGATTSDDVNNKWSLNMGRSRKGNEKRFFWQYNVQSKGPKAPKYSHSVGSFDTDSEDPHVFKETADPVFAEDCQIEGVKHSGKARRGDGNDLTPNPKKLLMIGLELKKLSKIINDLTPVTDVPAPSRDKTRKEKNKLASRACRLKKKAQHEANKIKLHGLHREHSKLMRTISDMRKVIQWNISARESMIPCSKSQPTAPSTCVLNLAGAECHVSPATDVQALMQDTVARNRPLFSVSTHTADFVNHVLDNVSAGVANGGIDDV